MLKPMDLKIDPAVAGLTAGVIHHFSIQYPKQATLFNTLYAFALINVIFTILLLEPKNPFKFDEIGHTIKDLLIFDAVYVRPLFKFS
jgi:hypothetical protein